MPRNGLVARRGGAPKNLKGETLSPRWRLRAVALRASDDSNLVRLVRPSKGLRLMGMKIDSVWKPDRTGLISESRVTLETPADTITDLLLRNAPPEEVACI